MQTNMQYLGERQDVVSQNIANANTPGYQAKDLKPLKFDDLMKSTSAASSVQLASTNQKHLGGLNGGANNFASDKNITPFEVSPTGNKVVIEEEVMKVAKNSMEYQKTTNIYRKMLQMFKTAVGDQ